MSGNMGDTIQDLLKQARKMQEQMQDAQKELTEMLVVGESGGGLVVVKMNGRHDVLNVKLHPGLMEEDVEMIGDLVAAAFNDAVRKIESASKDKINQLTAGLKIPTDLGDITGTDGSSGAAEG